MLWENWNQWTLTELRRLNRSILAGTDPPRVLNERLSRVVLDELPAAEAFTPQDACRVLVLLGLAGASVARHFQEADLGRKATPGESFAGLRVGAAQIPFPEYFAALAARTGTGHCARDSYASLVRWNAPRTEVVVDGAVMVALPGSFPDLSIRTYTDDPGELAFFEMLKKSEAYEVAINETLEPVADGSVDIRSAAAARRAFAATRLMAALIRYNQDFAGRTAEDGGLRTDHFMDVFRQFAVHWRPGDLPPTGAQDPEFLRRDFLLGIDYPGYDEHVLRTFPALLDSERAMLTRSMQRPPLAEVLLRAFGLEQRVLADSPPDRLRAIVREHPELAAWYLLFAANAKFGAVHLMLTEKYLFKPQRMRDHSGIGDHPLVSNRRGTTGMEESQLVRLTRARRNHPLRYFGLVPDRDLAAISGLGPFDVNAGDLPQVRFASAGM